MTHIYIKQSRSPRRSAPSSASVRGMLWNAIVTRKILVFSMIFLIVTLPIFFLVTKYQSKIEAAWMSDNWLYRTGLTIGNTGSADSDKKVKFDIDTATLITAGKLQSDCGDSRFTDINGRALKYFIDTAGGACNTNSTDYYVLVPTINAGNTVLYHYYGNPSAQNGTVSAQFSQATFSPTSGPTAASEENGPAPAAYWKFDEGYGTNAQDSTANNNDGTIIGSTWQTEDKCISGKCLYFDGSNDVATVSNTVSGVQTVSFWVRPITTSEQFIDLNGSAYIQSSSGTISATGFTSPTIYVNGKVSSTVVANQWQYVSVTTASAISASAVKVGQISTNYGQGFFDDVKIYPYARTAAQIKADFASKGSGSVKGTAVQMGSNTKNSDAFSNGLVGYWKMDETSWTNDCTATSVTDSSGNGNNGKACPATTGPTGGTAGKFGNAGSFDGSNDYVEITHNNIFNFGASNFSITVWFKPEGTFDEFDTIFSKSDALNHNNYVNALFFRSGELRWVVDEHVDGNLWDDYVTISANASSLVGSWHQAQMVREGNVIKGYLDGALTSTYTLTDNFNLTNSSSITLGNESSVGTPFTGKIDDVRIYNRALSSKEVRDLYNWAPGPVGYWNMDEKTGQTVNDISGNGLSATLGLNSSVNIDDPTWTTGKFGAGLSFDGGDYVARGTGPTIINSVSFWTYPTSTTNYFIDLNGSAYISVTSGTLSATGFSSPTIYVNGVVSSTLAANQWQYITVTTATNLNASALNFGKISTNYLAGKLDEVRLYNYVRNSKQITEDMNAGHPVGGSPIGSQIGYWKFDEGQGIVTNNAGNGGSALNGTLTLMASPATSTSGWSNSGKFNKALNFDGSNDYVNFSSLNLGTENSFSFWMNYTDTGDGIIIGGAANVYATYISGPASNNSIYYAPSSGNFASVVHGGFTSGTWYHIAVVRNGTSVSFFKNGVKIGTTQTLGANNSLTVTDLGKEGGGFYFKGALDEVKIYSSALTEDEIKLDYNRGSAMVLGSTSTTSAGVPDNSSTGEYCVPGSSDSCSAPVGEWKMDEGSGASAQDSSGGGSTGTITGATYQPGKIGKALNFNAGTDAVAVSNSLSTKTVEFWVYPTTTTQSLIDLRTDATAANISVSSGTISATGFTSPTIYVNGKVSSTLSAGSWQQVTITTGTAITANAIRFGRISATSLTGKLDLIRIFDYARTPAQVAWDYNRGGPVGWWKMDECQGGTANDASGNGNNGTITIGATGTNTSAGTCTGSAGESWKDGATGKYNSSLEFDGTDDYVNNTSLSSTVLDFDNKSLISISLWAKVSGGANDYLVELPESSSGNNGPGIQYDSGNIYFHIVTHSDSSITDVSTSVSTDQWYMLTLTYDGTTLKGYKDGKFIGSHDVLLGIGLKHAAKELNIGRFGTWGGYFNGQIDDVRVYNYALTAVQIKNLYNENSSIRFGPNSGSP